MQRLILLVTLVCLASGCSVPDFGYQPPPSTEALNACRDHQLSLGEADVDCGGNCPTACPSGAACMMDSDCANASCVEGVCTDETCADAVKNQDETDIDCGGKTGCARCELGAACVSNNDCGAGTCIQSVCAAQTCSDGIKDQDESDVDCGGTTGCAPCVPGKTCSSNDDCNGGGCTSGMCRAPSCTDGLKNQTESDIDCGGTCGPCANGKSCVTVKDCDLALCTGGKCRSQSCSDGVLNQDETDVDCGGSTECARCATAQHCLSSGDCNNASCSKGSCQPTSCTDGVKNGSETDVDCGSTCSKPCADTKGCALPKDCTSQICSATTHTCQAPTCTDGVKNGSEPTLDCGATCTKKCASADICVSPADCASGQCTNSRCMPTSATGVALPMTGWVASASQSFSGNPPGLGIDGNLNTLWTNGTTQNPGMWFQWDMTKPQAFFSITMTESSSTSDYARNVRLSGSMDGVTFTELRTNIVGQNVLKIVFADAQIARYLKLELLSSTAGLWWRIDELSVAQ
ncbi:MAG: discoidin domain-containing protein [Pseudomonadota bacterium]